MPSRLAALLRGRVAAFLALALALAAISLFVVLWRGLSAGVSMPFDEPLLHAAAGHRTTLLTVAALNVTALGSGIVLTLFTVLLALTFHRLGHPRSARVLLLAGAGAWALTTLLKNVVERDRPETVPRLVEVLGFSFPSGHSLGSAAIYGTAAVLVAVQTRRRGDRVLIAVLAAVLLAAIGASRVYLGVHYPSDVLAGYSAGLAWAFLLLAAAAFKRRATGGEGP